MSRRSERRQRRRERSVETGEDWGRRSSKRMRDRERALRDERGLGRPEPPYGGGDDEGIWYRGGRNR